MDYVEIMTLEKRPLKFGPVNWKNFIGDGVPIEAASAYFVVKDGHEVKRDDRALSHPSADCWFAVHLKYPSNVRRDGTRDYDVIITDGDEYFRVRRSLGKSPLVFNVRTKAIIDRAVRALVNDVTATTTSEER